MPKEDQKKGPIFLTQERFDKIFEAGKKNGNEDIERRLSNLEVKQDKIDRAFFGEGGEKGSFEKIDALYDILIGVNFTKKFVISVFAGIGVTCGGVLALIQFIKSFK